MGEEVVLVWDCIYKQCLGDKVLENGTALDEYLSKMLS